MKDLIELPRAGTTDKSRGDFLEVLRRLVHKLSQPLTSLRGSTEVALMGEIEESECRRILERSLEESHRMAEILETLRDVLEIESSGGEVQPVFWTQSVRKLLQEAVSSDRNRNLHLVWDAIDEVWVKASPQHLEAVTGRFIGRVIRTEPGNPVIRVGLADCGNTACLSISPVGTPPDAGPTANKGPAHSPPEILDPGDLDWWILRHAIARQGGALRINGAPLTGCSYELTLPRAPATAIGKARTAWHRTSGS